jgi:hypothetical protein
MLPSPSAPPPMAIATTVHCMRTCPRKKVVPGTSPVRHQPHQGKDEDQNRVSTKLFLYILPLWLLVTTPVARLCEIASAY